jgi:hypothetical protein
VQEVAAGVGVVHMAGHDQRVMIDGERIWSDLNPATASETR